MSDTTSTPVRARRGRGEGGIEQLPSGKFRAIRSLGTDPATGKQRKESRAFDTKRKALAWLRDRQDEVRGEWARKPLGEWLDHWLAMKKPNVEPATYVWYERRVRLYLTPRLGAVRLGDLKPIHVRELLGGMAKDAKTAGEQFKSLKTLRAALEDAVRLEQVGRNVARAVKLPRVKSKEMYCLDRDQACAFLKAAGADRLAAMYDLALDAGMRPGELFALHWPDVDLGGRSVFVRWSLEEIAGKVRLKEPKTRAGRRRILIATRTVDALCRHQERMLAEGQDVEHGPVFCGPQGGFLRISDVRRLSFLLIVKRADLANLRMYDLRHTSATLLLSQDVNIKVVAQRLGHEDIAITLRHYSHALPVMQEKAAAAVDTLYGMVRAADNPTGIPRTSANEPNSIVQNQMA